MGDPRLAGDKEPDTSEQTRRKPSEIDVLQRLSGLTVGELDERQPLGFAYRPVLYPLVRKFSGGELSLKLATLHFVIARRARATKQSPGRSKRPN